MNPYLSLQLVELLKGVYVHGDSKQLDERLLVIHEELLENVERENQGYKLRANKGGSRKGFKVDDLIRVHLRKKLFPNKRNNKITRLIILTRLI